MIKAQDAIYAARALLGTPYAELDCINLIKKVIRTAPGGVSDYTTAGTNALWDSYGASEKYRDLTWRQEGLAGAKAGMLAFKREGSDVHHVGIVTGEGTVIHSSSAQRGRGVVETALSAREGWGLLAIHRYIETRGNEMSETVLMKAKVVTAQGALNLRAADSAKSAIIGTLPRHAVVDVYERGADFWRVGYEGQTGWASKAYLSPLEDAQSDWISLPRETAQALYQALGEALYAGNAQA